MVARVRSLYKILANKTMNEKKNKPLKKFNNKGSQFVSYLQNLQKLRESSNVIGDIFIYFSQLIQQRKPKLLATKAIC